MAHRELPDIWEEQHNTRPVLCETFVDPTQFDGACYKAANGQHIGTTAGQGKSKPAKDISVKPFDPNFRAVLTGEKKPLSKRNRQKAKRTSLQEDPHFTAMWSRMIDAATRIAHRHDATWIQRHRTLTTLIVMLLIVRLVLSGGRHGSTTIVTELWEQCQRLGVPLAQPVVASSIGKARVRVHEDIFRDFHRDILAHDIHNPPWHGHRTFAIDGSKLNLPRTLLDQGDPLPNENADSPHG